MKNILINFLLSSLIAIAGLFIYNRLFGSSHKIAYIRSGAILSNYKAMIIANEQFSKEIKTVMDNIDTLQKRFEKLKQQESVATGQEKSKIAYQLGVSENELRNYSGNAQQQMEKRKKMLTDEVLNKINTYIQEYGKKNGFTLIMGTTSEGSILYGEENMDITDTILTLLNEAYKTSDEKTVNK